jgi:predicted nucleic acid-binding Zn ribbon protein
MSLEGPRSLADLLQSGNLQSLRAEAQRRRTLTEQVRSRLPAADAAHVIGAHREADGRLVVTADSSAWAARLRFIADDAGLGNVHVRVAPPADRLKP